MEIKNMEIIKWINYVISIIFMVCYAYQIFYIVVPNIAPLFKRKKPHKKAALHKYAVLISARNERSVITQLIDSINNQDYPTELITIFVVADNCTDDTVQLARNAGAVVYERFNDKQVGKGYALNYLLERISEDYEHGSFDAYFVLDADNLLSENYITEMNKTFSDGYNVLTSYRNSKNYDSNWISAGYALWFLREAKYLNQARMLLHTSCAVSGTGFMFSQKILDKMGGWNFFTLTEDIEFTVYNIVNGEKIGYCGTAVLYDEQPVKFSQSWRQRLRWAKGYLQVFRKYGFKLIGGILTKFSFSCFDMTMTIMPAIVLTAIAMIANIITVIFGIASGGNVLIAFQSIFEAIANAYLLMFLVGTITTVTEWKQIHTTPLKKIFYIFTFPLFMFTYVPIAVTAMFAKVEWKPIEHSHAKTLEEVRTK